MTKHSKSAKDRRSFLPCYPLHKVLASLLSHSDSLQVYTLAMRVRVEGRPHCCYPLHLTGRGAWDTAETKHAPSSFLTFICQ